MTGTGREEGRRGEFGKGGARLWERSGSPPTSSRGKRSLSSSLSSFHFWISGGISFWMYSWRGSVKLGLLGVGEQPGTSGAPRDSEAPTASVMKSELLAGAHGALRGLAIQPDLQAHLVHSLLSVPSPAHPARPGSAAPHSCRPLSFPSTALTTLSQNCLSPPLDWEQGEGRG